MTPETHFLIVDDYSNIRTLVRTQLNGLGFVNVVEHENVDNAVSFLESNPARPVDFIISDWNMPGKSGLDFLNWVRASNKYKNLPFLIITTEDEQIKIMSAIQAGVSNFIFKPWEPEELGIKLQLCWKKHNK